MQNPIGSIVPECLKKVVFMAFNRSWIFIGVHTNYPKTGLPDEILSVLYSPFDMLQSDSLFLCLQSLCNFCLL